MDTPKTPLPSTIYRVRWGNGLGVLETRYFRPEHATDAAMMFGQAILRMEQSASSACYVGLKRLPDSVYPEGLDLAHWTKTSDERPPHIGFATLDEALAR